MWYNRGRMTENNQAGGQVEIEAVYEVNFEKIYRFFYYKTLSRDIAEDLTSETFLRFVEEVNKRKHQEAIENYHKYLFGIARIVFLTYLRKKYNGATVNVAPQYFDQYVQEFLEDVGETPTLEERAIKYIERLPEKQKIVASMRLIQKMSNREIAEKLGRNANYVKVTFKRAMKSMKILVSCTP
jgi:RNA polymerase sigma factor (sigma-70 family)